MPSLKQSTVKRCWTLTQDGQRLGMDAFAIKHAFTWYSSSESAAMTNALLSDAHTTEENRASAEEACADSDCLLTAELIHSPSG